MSEIHKTIITHVHDVWPKVYYFASISFGNVFVLNYTLSAERRYVNFSTFWKGFWGDFV